MLDRCSRDAGGTLSAAIVAEVCWMAFLAWLAFRP